MSDIEYTVETDHPLILDPEYEVTGASVGTYEDNNADHGENPELHEEDDEQGEEN